MGNGPQILRFQRGLPTSRQFGERLRLLVVQGSERGVCYSLLGDNIFIGREESQITLNDNNISRKHAEIVWKGTHYEIHDLGSANGVVFNGQKLKESVLKPGDIFMVGLTVLEVYAPVDTKKNESPLISGGKKKQAAKLAENEKKIEKKNEINKKRMIIYFLIFAVFYFVFLSEPDTNTIKGNARLPPPEEDAQPKKKKSKSEIKDAIKEYMTDYSVDTQQRKDAEVFFRNGVREIQNKNYRRAITAFETALTVDPTHDLAKIYLKSAKKDMAEDIKSMSGAAVRAKKSLRYKEARMHYENIIRYLEGDTENKMYIEAQEALKAIDKEENKFK